MAVTVSPKFQVVIPKEIRESMKLHAGQRMEVFVEDGQILMVPVKPIKQMRGFVRGISSTVQREKVVRV